VLYLHWALAKPARLHLALPLAGFAAIALSLWFSTPIIMTAVVLGFSFLSLFLLPRNPAVFDHKEQRWDFLLNHPARILLATFSGLCLCGTGLLALPGATEKGGIDLIDAAFTSVSAVCVTGLIVLDTPRDFTVFGQFSILLLIQLGGLGIMTIATVGLQAMGRRLSLRQERLLTTMTDTAHKDLFNSLAIILKFTLVAETLGSVLLAALFYSTGDSAAQALWRGIFTAVSAFCNAGFALQSDSLIAYQENPLLLFIISSLIIAGGLAPATSLMIPKWLTGKPIPISSRIALITTAILLLAGTFLIMVCEWNGFLTKMSFGKKLLNAWFQSATLRTAGFNSVKMGNPANPTFLIMLVFMFIGGSPGGTAGGIKTTTLGILAMTFWANITNRGQIIIQNRRLHPATIYHAITIAVSGIVIWLVIVLMLESTQPLSARNLIFEATSAMATVGLSTGATAFLDEIGKTIIIIAMFVGRIGPLTLFMLLSEEQTTSEAMYPVENISIT